MTNELILIGGVLLIGSWFFLTEKKSYIEKIAILLALIFVYSAYRMMMGASLNEVFAPLIEAVKGFKTS